MPRRGKSSGKCGIERQRATESAKFDRKEPNVESRIVGQENGWIVAEELDQAIRYFFESRLILNHLICDSVNLDDTFRDGIIRIDQALKLVENLAVSTKTNGTNLHDSATGRLQTSRFQVESDEVSVLQCSC
jgi:hypothetical protein